jgi:hypothetical protein
MRGTEGFREKTVRLGGQEYSKEYHCRVEALRILCRITIPDRMSSEKGQKEKQKAERACVERWGERGSRERK